MTSFQLQLDLSSQNARGNGMLPTRMRAAHQARSGTLRPCAALRARVDIEDPVKEADNRRGPATESHKDLSHALHSLKGVQQQEEALTLFPTSHLSGPLSSIPILLLYFPLGCALAAVRMTLWIILLLADQPWLTDSDASIAVLQAVLGIRVRWQHLDRLPKQQHVMVSNHVSTGDMIALYSLPQSYVHLVSSALPHKVAMAKHHRVDLQIASRDMYDKLANGAQTKSIHLFPEGGMTNASGMMRFSRGFMRFADKLPVVPVAARAHLPLGISTHTLTSSFLANMFWFCFSPYVTLHMTVLPPMRRSMGQGKGKFVESVQRQIAKELNISIHDFTVQQKKQLKQ